MHDFHQLMTRRENPQVLVADDEDAIRHLVDFMLEKAGFDVCAAADGKAALEMVNEDFSVVLLDLRMPVMDGMATLKVIRERHPDLPVLIMSAHGDVRDAVRAMKLGAFDYIQKPFEADELLGLVRQASRMKATFDQNRTLKASLAEVTESSGFVSQSPAGQELFTMARKVADTESTLLLTGESGVGKSLLARTIHQLSRRRSGPLVSVSAPSLPRELLEAELFGHERGAFTGAHQRRLGRVELADGGTLFIDEVGELPLDLQPKLLTFLQDRRFQRIGGSNEITADVRVIAATNANLEEQVQSGEFREDLFFRLNVIPISIPPLRERQADILPLVKLTLERIARVRGMPAASLAEDAREALLRHNWPGNIRELENIMERASALCTAGVIRREDLRLREIARRSQTFSGFETQSPPPSGTPAPAPATPEEIIPLEQQERTIIENAIQACGGNKAVAARRLGISEKTIYNKFKRFRAENQA